MSTGTKARPLEQLMAFDRDESRYGRAVLMASFLQWLAPRLDEVRAQTDSVAKQLAAERHSDGGAVRGYWPLAGGLGGGGVPWSVSSTA